MRRTVVVLGLITLAVSFTLLGTCLLHNWVMFGQLLGTGPPPRIDWCGRRYYPQDPAPTLTLAQLRMQPPIEDPLVRVLRTPSRMPVFARVMSKPERKAFDTDVCTITMYVEVRVGVYLEYVLSGGP